MRLRKAAALALVPDEVEGALEANPYAKNPPAAEDAATVVS